ncbi:MAG: hypothetical protein ACE5IQ_07945 [Candidatus Methylomirabilales bacterium]
MEAGRAGKFVWLWGGILILASCASAPEVVMRSLPLAGEASVSGASVSEVSLREVDVSGRADRIFLAWVSLKNRTGTPLPFGPQFVYLADAGGALLFRISEKWLPKYYRAKVRGIPAAPNRRALVPFPLANVTVGDSAFVAPRVTPAQRGQMAIEMAKLVEAAFVRPQSPTPGTLLPKGPEVALGALITAVMIRPDDRVSGYVYFYHSATRRPPYPLELVVKLPGEIRAFRFPER